MSMCASNLRRVMAAFVPAGLLALAGCAGAPPAAQPAPAAPPAPLAPVFVLDDILGAGADAIDALLGPAALVRREGAGEFRRYSLSKCSLLVILYPDENGEPAAAHVEAAALRAGEDKPDAGECLAAG